jgi:integrase/recombinase XerD
LDDHVRFCGSVGADPLTVRPDVIANWIGYLHTRPNGFGMKVRHLDSRAGLSQATIQQRISAVRSFYEYLVEDGLRDRNPVRRGESGRRGRSPKRGLVGRVEWAPWIPNELAWALILDACGTEPLRNRLMVAMAYDGALRREELVQIEIDDLEPAHALIHLRAETTKTKRARYVAFGTGTGQLLVAYLRERYEARLAPGSCSACSTGRSRSTPTQAHRADPPALRDTPGVAHRRGRGTRSEPDHGDAHPC